jgi:hypothetical protein
MKPSARIERSRPEGGRSGRTVTSIEVTLTTTSLVDALHPGVSSDSASGRGC